MRGVSVGQSIQFGLDRTRDVLFGPFRWRKWAAIAVGGMLMLTGEGGVGETVNYLRVVSPVGKRVTFDEAMGWLQAHLAMVITVVVLLSLVGFGVYLLLRWLSSRGHFMMYDSVVEDRADPGESWRVCRRLGNSLFKFRIVYDLVVFNVFLVVAIIAGALVWPDVRALLVTGEYPFSGWTIAAVVAGVVLTVVAGVLALFAHGLVFGLGLPVMYARDMEAWPAVKTAWREMVKPEFKACVLYLLFRIVIGMARGTWQMITLSVFLLGTCCTGFIVLVLPVVGWYPVAALSLPVLMYERAYGLHFVSQFGPAYAVGWKRAGLRGFPVELNGPAAGGGEHSGAPDGGARS